jgi:two-component system, cell cycle sensor histidine kinase and response regulator CckA
LEDQLQLRVMLVDDEDMLVRLGTRVMERLGHKVSGFTDPEEAAANLHANPDQYDLVVTDYSMPSLSGLELAQIVSDRAPDVPVVLVTGYGDLGAEGMPSSIKKLLQKPFTVDQLREVLAGFSPRA